MNDSTQIRVNARGNGAALMHRPAALDSQLSEIARLLERHSGTDGVHKTPLPNVTVVRQSAPTGYPIHSMHQPAMCLIVQGAKQVILNSEVYAYDASRYLVV